MIESEKLPKISIITPSYNQGQYLEKTILSVLNQNYANLEFIIIDGGSTDNSVDIIKKYQDRITYWVSEKDKGTYEANNKALAKVTGDYWCIVNSDDILLPRALDTVVETILKNPEQKWFAGGADLIDENDRVFGNWPPKVPSRSIEGLTFIYGCWIPHPAVFLHKSLIQEFGEFKKYHCMDYEYWMRLESAGLKPFLVGKDLAALRFHSECKSWDKVKAHEQLILIVSEFIESKGLSKHEKVVELMKEKYRFLKYLQLQEALEVKNKKGILKLLVEIFSKTPQKIFTRWYLGGVKQYLKLMIS